MHNYVHACGKLSPLHELFYFRLFKYFYLYLFHVNVISKK